LLGVDLMNGELVVLLDELNVVLSNGDFDVMLSVVEKVDVTG